MIIFVGSKLKGFFAEEVAKERDYGFSYVNEKSNIKEQVNDILFIAKKCKCIIYDVEQYINPAEEIAETIKTVADATNAMPIAYAPSFMPGAALPAALLDRDIKNFIRAGSAADMKDQLEKNLTGFYDANDRKELAAIEEKREEDKKLASSLKTIAVAGSMRRIGTTTQAIQICKYLSLKGYKVCYIQLNNALYPDSHQSLKASEIGYVEKVKSWFEVEKVNEDLGMVRCFSVDMFYKQEKIPEVLKQGYDYYIFDYGVYTDQDFNRTAFIQADVQIIVVGSSPTELEYTQNIAQSSFYQDAKLLFSFVAEEEKEELIMLMDEIKMTSGKSNGARSFFTSFVPDPFVFSNLDLWEDLLPIEDISEDAGQKKRKGLFGRKKKGGSRE
jgi:predicted CoA-binding protein